MEQHHFTSKGLEKYNKPEATEAVVAKMREDLDTFNKDVFPFLQTLVQQWGNLDDKQKAPLVRAIRTNSAGLDFLNSAYYPLIAVEKNETAKVREDRKLMANFVSGLNSLRSITDDEISELEAEEAAHVAYLWPRFRRALHRALEEKFLEGPKVIYEAPEQPIWPPELAQPTI